MCPIYEAWDASDSIDSFVDLSMNTDVHCTSAYDLCWNERK